METMLSEKKTYQDKEDYLNQYFEAVSPLEFYRDIFPAGSLERAGHPEDGKANGILTVIEENRAYNRVVFDDLNMIQEHTGEEFVIISPISYAGKNRTADMARWLYGFAFDLDGVELQNLRDLFFEIKNGILPRCTYCINSGHGVHLYYLLDRPLPLYKNMRYALREFKYALTERLWNRFTSTYTERQQVQYQGIFQGFRMVGTQSKLGEGFPVTAYRTGERVTVDYLNSFLPTANKAIVDFHQSKMTLAEAKAKYPAWYDLRIIQKQKRTKHWHVSRALYDWWLKQIRAGAAVGHRYSCLTVLASYGIKCDIPEDEVMTDALQLLPFLDELSDTQTNRFTQGDVMDAMKYYQDKFFTLSRREAEKVSGISMPANKRNGRKQDVHLARARAVQEIDYPEGTWRTGNGRHSKQLDVAHWQAMHPEGRKVDCIRDTGISKPTVYKYWM